MAKQVASQNDVSKRLLIEVALLDYCRMVNVSEADIDRLYQQVERLNEKAFENENAMDVVINYKLDEINSRDALKERLSEMKSQLAERIFDYYAIDLNSENAVLIRNVLNNAGIDKNESKSLSEAICQRKLHEPCPYKKDQRMADRLVNMLYANQKKLKTKLKEDFNTYKAIGLNNVIINDLKPDILEYIGGVNHNQVLVYQARFAQEKFRNCLREDFIKKNGIRENFVKITGLLAYNGMNLVKGETQEDCFANFCDIMKKVYGDNYMAELDKALCIPTDMTEEQKKKQRIESFNAKSKEMYFKMMAGILSKKIEFDHKSKFSSTSDYSVYVSTVENKFIRQLLSGITDVRSLCIEEPDYSEPVGSLKEERALYRQSLGETTKKKVVSVHHKLPVGAAYDVCDRLCPSQDPKVKFQNSCELVNNLGNVCFVVGKELHQKLEADGNYVMRHMADNSIFVAETDPQILNRGLPKYLKEGLGKYVGKSKGVVKVLMNFTESQVMANEREKLQPEAAEVSIDRKYARYT